MRAWPGTMNLIATDNNRHIGERLFDATQQFVSLTEKLGHKVQTRHYNSDGGSSGGHVAITLSNEAKFIGLPIPHALS